MILDWLLPEVDGIELLPSILDIADVPVIFLSAYGREDVIARALRARGHRLRGQALFADGAGGQGAGRPAPERSEPGIPWPGEPYVIRGTCGQLPGTAGLPGRPAGAADRHRIPAPSELTLNAGVVMTHVRAVAAGLGGCPLGRRPAGAGAW